MNQLILTIFLFANLYSPFSAFTATGINVLIATYVLINKNFRIKLSSLSRFLIILSLVILVWTFLVSLFNWTFSSYVIGRFARILINTFLIAIIVENRDIDLDKFVNSLAFVLIINTFAVYLQTLLPSTKAIFAPMANYQKEFFPIRAFGLFAAYDSTGLCSCITLIMFARLYKYHNNLKFIVGYFVVLISTVFVSRTSMVVSILITLYFSAGFTKALKWKLVYFTPIAALGLYYFYINAAKIFIATFVTQSQEVGSSYYAGSQDRLVNNMIFFPTTLQGFLIGIAQEPHDSDIGYIKLIFMIGILGLILILFGYFIAFKYLQKAFRKVKKTSIPDNAKLLYSFVLFYLFFMLLFNGKLLLLYGRGFHDIFLISLLSTAKSYCKINIENKIHGSHISLLNHI